MFKNLQFVFLNRFLLPQALKTITSNKTDPWRGKFVRKLCQHVFTDENIKLEIKEQRYTTMATL